MAKTGCEQGATQVVANATNQGVRCRDCRFWPKPAWDAVLRANSCVIGFTKTPVLASASSLVFTRKPSVAAMRDSEIGSRTFAESGGQFKV